MNDSAKAYTIGVACVVADRVRSYLCENTGCCPVEGRRLDPSEALRLEASLVERGSAPLRSRQALVRVLTPRADDDPVLAAVEHARPGAQARQSPDQWSDVDDGAAAAWLRAAGAQVMVHGHTHRPGSSTLAPGFKRHVLSDWDLDTGTRAEVLRLTRRGFERLAPAGP